MASGIQDIQKELDRIVGGPSVRVSDLDTKETANRRVKLETANATYRLPRNRLASFLGELPDGVGVNALRQALEKRLSTTPNS